MPVYTSTAQFYDVVGALFDRVQLENPQAAEAIKKAKLLIRFSCTDPEGTILINGRREPVDVSFGTNRIRPEVDVYLKGDTLHSILLGDLKLGKALATRELTVRGPAHKTLAVSDLFRQCQAIYPLILKEKGVNP